MKAIVTGVQISTGIAKKTGKAFKIASVFVSQPIETISMENYQKRAIGYEQVEVPATDEGIAELLNLTDLPCEVDLIMDSRVRNGKLESLISGIVKTAKK